MGKAPRVGSTGLTASQFWNSCALIGILASLVSVYYYLRPIMAMYFRDEEAPLSRVESSWGLHLTLFATSLATLAIGLFPQRLIELSERSIRSLGG